MFDPIWTATNITADHGAAIFRKARLSKRRGRDLLHKNDGDPPEAVLHSDNGFGLTTRRLSIVSNRFVHA
ncbi:MAG: hypothetical protein EOS04_35735 [Mesorhizobium sp.]|uniref:hypothetical protein n=1 Tax=Mesorhizobium sp. TaxID=1871066 RepID=UPI000FE2FB28|nr:hypothetical protein [Mesorhizobium sp.]RWN48097.1 MAG: hypothetical protein EOR98_35885 [Mesorhizobium sp.]RWN69493.1 MAG: hypothetical protein EOS02_34805 [Mesorhizobium sp.]RWN71297.1 MAG: hypothetical protein EOS01_31195 [Mesorhizobium sp.]RWN78592.1 MAG: hypothetical protein EOS04_35735 [Mesorhizobium sp.]RWO06714.1 MAG: hypothetical protein EOS15_32970 [Mesorhizobium sp.]